MKLKSKVLSAFDYKAVDLSGSIPDFEPDEERLAQDMERARRAHGTKVTAYTVEQGDFVRLTCRSEMPRFQKDGITVMVGRGLYSRPLEAQLVGMKAGETRELEVNGTAVTVTVNGIERNVLPELTDASVASWGMEGVDSVADLRHACINKQIDRFLEEDEGGDMAVAMVSTKVMEESVFELDEEEVQLIDAEAEHQMESILAENGLTWDTLTPEQAQEFFSCDKERFRGFLYNMYQLSLKTAVMGQQLWLEDRAPLTEEDYRESIRRRAISLSCTEEQAAEIYPASLYLKDEYADYYIRMLDSYVADEIKKALNP